MEEERLLLARTDGTETTPVVLRLGMVYGPGILMLEVAHWLARRSLLGVWKDPTWIHLISAVDYLSSVEAAIRKPEVEGIYHVGDDGPVTLQHFLDEACRVWGCPRPRRLPVWSIYTAAWLSELFASVAGTRSPLTRGFIRIGRVSYFGDTRRARRQLHDSLVYPSLMHGLTTLRREAT